MMESTLTPQCPERAMLIDLAYDVLSEAEADLLHPHVQACPACRQEYAALLNTMKLADALPLGPVAPSPAIRDLLRLEVAAMRPWHERFFEQVSRWLTLPVPAWQAFAVGAFAAVLTQLILSSQTEPPQVADRLDPAGVQQQKQHAAQDGGVIRRLEPVPVMDVKLRHREELQFGDAFVMRDATSDAR